jgi:hypothetical protein
MRLQEWEVTIQEAVDECNQGQEGVNKVLIAWRAKLEGEPIVLQAFQIDEIMREVRRRLGNASE